MSSVHVLLKQLRNLESLLAAFESALELAIFIIHVVDCWVQVLAGDVVAHVLFVDAAPAAVVALKFPPRLMLLHEVLFEARDGFEVC